MAGDLRIAPITLYDTSGMKAKLAGEVAGFEPADYMESGRRGRWTALPSSPWPPPERRWRSGLELLAEDPYRCGVIVSWAASEGSPPCSMSGQRGRQGVDRISPSLFHGQWQHVCGSDRHQTWLSRYGVSTTACAGGTNAVGDASDRSGTAMPMWSSAEAREAVVNELAMGRLLPPCTP